MLWLICRAQHCQAAHACSAEKELLAVMCTCVCTLCISHLGSDVHEVTQNYCQNTARIVFDTDTHTHRYAHTPYVHHTCTIMYTNPQTRSCTDRQHVQNTHVLTNTDVHTPHTNAHTYVHAQKCTHNHNHVHTQTYPPPHMYTHKQICTEWHTQSKLYTDPQTETHTSTAKGHISREAHLHTCKNRKQKKPLFSQVFF